MDEEPRYIAVLECTDAGGFEIGLAVTQMGFRPLFLLDPKLYSADLAMGLQNFEHVTMDTRSASDIVALLDTVDKTIVGVTTLVDSRIPVAAQVASMRAISGPDPACMKLNDKARVAKYCPNVSPRSTIAGQKSASVPAGEILEEWNRCVGEGPVVVKPRVGCGAVGMKILKNESHKRAFIDTTPRLDEWLVQEHFVGSLYSIEGWVDTSGAHYLGWSSRRKIQNTETEFRFEGFNSIPDSLTKDAMLAVEQLFYLSSFRRGWFHIEFLIDPQHTELRLIDANIGRTGGAMLPHVLAMAVGLQPADIYRHAIEAQLWGESKVRLPRPQLTDIHKCICFGSPEAVTIQDVRIPQSPLEAPSLRVTRILGSRDQVSKLGTDDWSWIGFVAGREDDVDRYVSQIEICTAQAVMQAAY